MHVHFTPTNVQKNRYMYIVVLLYFSSSYVYSETAHEYTFGCQQIVACVHSGTCTSVVQVYAWVHIFVYHVIVYVQVGSKM